MLSGNAADYSQAQHPRDEEDEHDGRSPKRLRIGPGIADSGYNNDVGSGISHGGLVGAGKVKNERQDVRPATSRTPAQDKNRRLSCKECRRLKLKCDRVFPCQSCIKRGCGSLCPEGALTAGRGSRFILANTEQLHEKITQLTDRVRELEGALEASSDKRHPLLSPEKLRVKISQELYGVGCSQQPHCQLDNPRPRLPSQMPKRGTAPGSVAVAGLLVKSPSPSDQHIDNPYPSAVSVIYPAPPEVPPDVLQLSATFPFPWSIDLRTRKRIRDALPPRREAETICEQAQKNALWQYHLDPSETFLKNLLHHCYSTVIEELSPRRLGLLLMMLAIGSTVDLTRPLGSLHGEAYHHLARAALSEIPLMEEPDFDLLHALFFMVWWHLIFSDNKKAVGYAWNLMGFVAKLAQGLGLHRDTPRLKGIPEEYEKRRAIFWELLNLDCRMSLSLGRPPSMCLSHVDTKTPSFHDAGLYVPKEEIKYHEWKNSFFIECLTPVLDAIVMVNPPSYDRFLEVDKLVRDFRVPSPLDEHKLSDAKPRFLVMQRALVSSSRDIALLQLHRRFFAEAMSSPEPFNLHHKYAPSVLATYLGAASLISTIETLFDHEPQLSARFLYFWFNAYSAAVTLSLFVFRAPLTPFALNASRELDRIRRLFRNAGKILPVSGRILPLVEKLATKARVCLKHHQGARTGSGENHIVRTWPGPGERLPVSLVQAHPSLLRYVEELKMTARDVDSPSPVASPSSCQSRSTTASIDSMDGAESWMPDPYRYAPAGVGIDAIHCASRQQPTPFMPSSPRVDGKEEFNLDHGSLAGEFGETSFMAWF